MASFKNVFSENPHERDLYRAIYSGNVDKVHYIIDSFKPKYLIPWVESEQLLTAALECKRLKIAKILLRRGCFIENTMTLYPQALLCGDVEFVKLLLDKDPRSLHNRLGGNTLLHMAVHEELQSMVKLLIDHGANVNVADSDGLFPLNFAAKRGNIGILRLLLDSGAHIENESVCERDTSLLCALKNTTVKHQRYKTVVKELLDAGANVNCRDLLGRTPLHIALFFTNSLHLLRNRDVLPLLINAGADVNSVDHQGMVPCDALMKKQMVDDLIIHINQPVPVPLLRHLILIKEAGLYLHERNKFIIDFTFSNTRLHKLSMINDAIKMSQNEINLMKKFKAVNGAVLYDIVKNLNKNSLYCTPESEIQLLKLVILQNTFPLYTVILRAHLKCAEFRSNLLTQAQDCLGTLINYSKLQIPHLPEEIIRHIIMYLENRELQLFIEGVVIMKEECKQQ